MKYVQGNTTNELITRSFKIKDIYNHDYKKPYFHGNKRISWPLLFFWQAHVRDCSGALNEFRCPC